MGPATSLHTDESDAQVRSEPQQLRARQPSAYHYLASPVQANKIKNLLPRSMPIVSSSMDRLLSHLLYPQPGRGGVGLPLRLAQTVKTLIAVRCKSLDRQDHCTAFCVWPVKRRRALRERNPPRNTRLRLIRTDERREWEPSLLPVSLCASGG